MIVNTRGPEGTVAALRATSPAMMMPVGAGALIGPAGGSPLGMADDGVRPPDPPGAVLDAALDALDRRITALEGSEAGEVA